MVDTAHLEEGKKRQDILLQSQVVRIKRVENMKKKNIIPCPLYNQHKMVLAVSSVLNKCFLVNSSNYRTSSLPLLEVYSQGQKGF